MLKNTFIGHLTPISIVPVKISSTTNCSINNTARPVLHIESLVRMWSLLTRIGWITFGTYVSRCLRSWLSNRCVLKSTSIIYLTLVLACMVQSRFRIQNGSDWPSLCLPRLIDVNNHVSITAHRALWFGKCDLCWRSSAFHLLCNSKHKMDQKPSLTEETRTYPSIVWPRMHWTWSTSISFLS